MFIKALFFPMLTEFALLGALTLNKDETNILNGEIDNWVGRFLLRWGFATLNSPSIRLVLPMIAPVMSLHCTTTSNLVMLIFPQSHNKPCYGTHCGCSTANALKMLQ